MRQTKNLKLSMPRISDNANIEDLNDNALILDQNIMQLQDNLAAKTELQKLGKEVENYKVDIKDTEQKLDKADNTRAEIFVEAEIFSVFSKGDNSKIRVVWQPEYGDLQTGTTLRVLIPVDLSVETVLYIANNKGGILAEAFIVDAEGQKVTDGIKAGSIITVAYNKNALTAYFILQGKGEGYAKIDYRLDVKGITKGLEEPLSEKK